MQIRLLMSIIFKRAKHKSMNHLRKNVQKEEIRYCAYFTFISRKFIWFYSDGHVW